MEKEIKILNTKKTVDCPELINCIINYMEIINGMATVSHICHLFNITPRTLERHFRITIGISPKALLHIFRITHAVRLLTENHDCDLTGISYESGYYDQSHFIRDIKEITGITPGQMQNLSASGLMSQKYNFKI